MSALRQDGAHPAAEDPSLYVRPEIRELAAYHLDLSTCRHKLDQNEVPWDLPIRLKEEATRRLLDRPWAVYPDFHGDELRAALGHRHAWPEAGVLVGNGSNELLGAALEALGGPGREVLIPVPGFGLYRMFALRSGAQPYLVGPAQNGQLPFEQILAEVRRDPRRPLILCSPNNPTGDALPPAHIDALLQQIQAPLLLDNAYGEFCDHDYRPLLDRHRHLVLLRTFSKAWSVAGIRLGYLLADPRLVRELIKVKLPYNVGHAAISVGLTVLAAEKETMRRIRLIRGRREQWRSMLEAAGLEVFPSEANFLLTRHPRAPEIWQGLMDRGIRVRDVSRYPALDHCLRFSVGSGRALRDTRRALVEILDDPEALGPRPPMASSGADRASRSGGAQHD